MRFVVSVRVFIRVCGRVCVQHSHIKRLLFVHMCEIIFLIAVTMCDLVNNVETIVYHHSLIFQKKIFRCCL